MKTVDVVFILDFASESASSSSLINEQEFLSYSVFLLSFLSSCVSQREKRWTRETMMKRRHDDKNREEECSLDNALRASSCFSSLYIVLDCLSLSYCWSKEIIVLWKERKKMECNVYKKWVTGEKEQERERESRCLWTRIERTVTLLFFSVRFLCDSLDWHLDAPGTPDEEKETHSLENKIGCKSKDRDSWVNEENGMRMKKQRKGWKVKESRDTRRQKRGGKSRIKNDVIQWPNGGNRRYNITEAWERKEEESEEWLSREKKDRKRERETRCRRRRERGEGRTSWRRRQREKTGHYKL